MARQKDWPFITNHGRPAAIVIGVEGEDLEDLMTRANPKFWEMIEEVRKQPTLSLEEAQEYFRKADDLEAKTGRTMTPAAAKKLVGAARDRVPARGSRAKRPTKGSP